MRWTLKLIVNSDAEMCGRPTRPLADRLARILGSMNLRGFFSLKKLQTLTDAGEEFYQFFKFHKYAYANIIIFENQEFYSPVWLRSYIHYRTQNTHHQDT